jgi:hypothetical protein
LPRRAIIIDDDKDKNQLFVLMSWAAYRFGLMSRLTPVALQQKGMRQVKSLEPALRYLIVNR